MIFILASHTPIFEFNDTKHLRGQIDVIVPVPDGTFLKSMRRNTKLFKMHGHLLFPWAKRILWRDAKLKRYLSGWTTKDDYLHYFKNAVEKHDACAAFVSLPMHPSSVSSPPPSQKTSLIGHCKTILEAAKKRPDVSDSFEGVIHQCHRYILDDTCEAPMDSGMIDSALIAWNPQIPRCVKFMAPLFTWSDEIHRHSDRDQLSFQKHLALQI